MFNCTLPHHALCYAILFNSSHFRSSSFLPLYFYFFLILSILTYYSLSVLAVSSHPLINFSVLQDVAETEGMVVYAREASQTVDKLNRHLASLQDQVHRVRSLKSFLSQYVVSGLPISKILHRKGACAKAGFETIVCSVTEHQLGFCGLIH